MTVVGRVVGLSAALLSFAGPLRGQQRPTIIVPLRLGRTVMVQMDGARFAGPLAAVGRDTLVLSARGGGPAAQATVAPTAQVEALWVRGTAWQTGAIIGGSIVGASFGLLATVGCAIGRSDNGVIGDEGRWVDCALIGGAIGFAAGGLVGGAIGAMVPKWHVRYRARGGAALEVRLDF